MVYRGKPSAACGECRKRRSRCDQAVPACGQCTKARRNCSGYRNAVDLMFHDETKQVARRNKGHVFQSAEMQVVSGSRSSEQALISTAAARPRSVIDFIMYQPVDDVGVSFFMSTYVGEDPAVSQLHYLPKFYAKTGYANTGLQQSIIAAGLAGYAKSARRGDLVDVATKHYIAAIQGINSALSDPKSVLQEATLLAIVMAAMFEVLILPRLSDMGNCSKHLEGAVTVALMMLKQKEPTDITRTLITTLAQSVIINSWISYVPLPVSFLEMKRRLGKTSESESIHGKFLDVVMELIVFREALQAGTMGHPETIAKQALAVDARLIKFAEEMPLNGRFETFRTQGQISKQIAYQGYYHVYNQRFSAHLWNNVRSSRLRLHQVILRQCRLILSSLPAQYVGTWKIQQAESKAQIELLAIEIVATIPQLAGYHESLEYQRLTEKELPLRSATSLSKAKTEEVPDTAQVIELGTMDNTTFFGNDPKPFPKGEIPVSQQKRTLKPDTDFDARELQVDAPARIFPPVSTAQPASVYHLLFQLYSLRSVPVLPTPFKDWVRERLAWLESISNPEDLVRLQDMVAKSPGDDFPVGSEG
ncbi:hypothetical protein DE146DRAFT_622961 [Phaeosphaeria sp. MPI-PUGE-AT-0046c]|nr:hypothetical protein DE146DRAFT_622961 [Phaeosphaeria sp. MPI-PUGE-AT-0046c]